MNKLINLYFLEKRSKQRIKHGTQCAYLVPVQMYFVDFSFWHMRNNYPSLSPTSESKTKTFKINQLDFDDFNTAVSKISTVVSRILEALEETAAI